MWHMLNASVVVQKMWTDGAERLKPEEDEGLRDVNANQSYSKEVPRISSSVYHSRVHNKPFNYSPYHSSLRVRRA